MSGDFEANVELQDKVKRMCEELDQDITFGEFSAVITLIEHLKNHDHNAESIACYLTLKTALWCDTLDLRNALIAFDIVKQ